MKFSSLQLRLSLVVAVAVLATGCASVPPPLSHGYFAAATPDVEVALANEAADVLRGTYPPGSTEFSVPEGKGAFGARFNSVLRRSGFAVAVVSDKSASLHASMSGTAVTYVVDQPAPGLFRVMLTVGPTTMTRAFIARAGGVGPAGAWSRQVKEGESALPEFVPVATPAATAFALEATPAVQFASAASPARGPAAVRSQTEARPSAGVTAVNEAAVSTTPRIERTTSWPVDLEPTLRGVFARWTALDGVALQWESGRDFPIDAAMRGTYSGSLKEALGQLAGKFGAFDSPLAIRFQDNGMVLRVYDLIAAGE